MAELRADEIARREFSVGFRGFDQQEVRGFLRQLAGELAASHARIEVLETRVVELERASRDLDEDALERALGQAATRIIHAAREASADMRAVAEAETERAVHEARRAVEAARADAERRGATIVDDARGKAESLVSDASAERDRVLDELSGRRQALLDDLEQLHAARERLVEAYRGVRAVLDDAVRATVQADRGAQAVADSPPPPAAVEADPAVVVPPVPLPVVESEPIAEPEPPAAELVAAPEPEPEPERAPAPEPVAHVAEAEERRSSALRLLRRRDNDAEPPIDLGDDFEGVRIIRPEPVPEPVPEPGPEPVPEPAAESVAQPEPESEEQPEPEPATFVDVDDEPAEEPAEVSEPVEDLFARLRADRAEKVARAEAVLGTPGVDAEPEAAPVEDAVAEVEEETPGDALLTVRDTAVADVERALLRSLKRAIADEQNEVLDALRRLRGAPVLAALLPEPAVHDARYGAVLSGASVEAARAGAAATGAAGGMPGTVPADFGQSVATDLRLRVDRAIDEASGDVETLTEAVSAAYREWKTARAEGLARDVVTAAFAAGVYSSTSGALRWVVDPGEGGCPDCDDNVLAGPTPKGTVYPTGQLHPPAHAGCRCVAVPVT